MLCYVNIVRGVVITWSTRINRRIGRRYASRPVIFPPRRPPRLFVWLSRRRGWSLASGVAVVFPSWPFFFWAAHVRGYPDDGDPVVLSSYSAAAYQIRGAPTIITDPSPPSPPPLDATWTTPLSARHSFSMTSGQRRSSPFLLFACSPASSRVSALVQRKTATNMLRNGRERRIGVSLDSPETLWMCLQLLAKVFERVDLEILLARRDCNNYIETNLKMFYRTEIAVAR